MYLYPRSLTSEHSAKGRLENCKKAESERGHEVLHVLWRKAASNTVYGGPARLFWCKLVDLKIEGPGTVHRDMYCWPLHLHNAMIGYMGLLEAINMYRILGARRHECRLA